MVHAVTRGRARQRRWIAEFASELRGARVLEIGSGKQVNGAYPYSSAELFDPSCDVVRSDFNPAFGHAVVDVTAMEYDGEFDAVLCANVLEHVAEPAAAVAGIARALRPGGVTLVTVPFIYPLHDEPIDFWRFTEHGLRHLFADYAEVHIARGGARVAPWSYAVTARP